MKKFWKHIKYWQKGMIIALLFVIFIYTPSTIINGNVCKPVPCGEACTPERPPVNPEACNFWSPIFWILSAMPFFR